MKMKKTSHSGVIHLNEHYIMVVGGAVVLRVGNQKLGQAFLLCALINAQGVITSHNNHSVRPAGMKSKLVLIV